MHVYFQSGALKMSSSDVNKLFKSIVKSSRVLYDLRFGHNDIKLNNVVLSYNGELN